MRRLRPIEVGCVARSLKGRDGGRLMIVLGLEGDSFATVADGKLRKVASPKRKRRSHLKYEADPIPDFAKRLAAGEGIGDFEIRAVLKAFDTEEEVTIG